MANKRIKSARCACPTRNGEAPLERHMSRCTYVSTMVAVLLLLSGRDSAASLVLPDAAFSFAAPVLDAQEATHAIGAALEPLGFKITRRPRVRDDGFFRAAFERSSGSSVFLSGRVSCTHVTIYTSREPKTAEAARLEAAEIYEHTLASLRAADSNLLLFKSSGGKRGCEEAL
jgi:hypothetical protein